MNLRTPGPTPIPQDILNSLAQPMIDHRGPFFREIYDRVSTRLQNLFETQNDVLMLTSSGSGGLEAAVVNTLSPKSPSWPLKSAHLALGLAGLPRHLARTFAGSTSNGDRPPLRNPSPRPSMPTRT